MSARVLAQVPTIVADPRQSARASGAVNNAKYGQFPAFLSGSTDLEAWGAGSVTLLVPHDSLGGEVEVVRLSAVSTGPFAVTIRETHKARTLTNNDQPVDSSLVFDTGMVPGRLPGRLLLVAGSGLEIKAFDLSGAANTVSLAATCIQVEDLDATVGVSESAFEALAREAQPFWVGPSEAVQTLGPKGSASWTFDVSGNADFEVQKIAARSSGPFGLGVRVGTRDVIPAGTPGFLACTMTGPNGPAAGALTTLGATWLLRRGARPVVSLTNPGTVPVSVSLALVGELLTLPQAHGGATHVTMRRTIAPAFGSAWAGQVVHR